MVNRESERKRLVELICKQSCNYNTCENSISCSRCKFVSLCDEEIEDLADALLDNGIVVPPVKAGNYIWFLKNDKLTFGQIEDITIARNGLFAFVYEVDAEDEVIGEWTVPLCEYCFAVSTSREDAERVLGGDGK